MLSEAKAHLCACGNRPGAAELQALVRHVGGAPSAHLDTQYTAGFRVEGGGPSGKLASEDAVLLQCHHTRVCRVIGELKL